MGTHPIFESDFDCLTECVLRQCDDWPLRKSSAPESNAELLPTGASREWRKSSDSQWNSTPTRMDHHLHIRTAMVPPIQRILVEVDPSDWRDFLLHRVDAQTQPPFGAQEPGRLRQRRMKSRSI